MGSSGLSSVSRGGHSRQPRLTHEIRTALFLMGELVAVLRANDPDLFKRWLSGGLQPQAEATATEAAPEKALQAWGADPAEGSERVS